MSLLARALTPDIDDVARLQYAGVPWRVAMAVLMGLLSGSLIGWGPALAWLGVTLSFEALTRVAARPAARGQVTLRQRAVYVASGLGTVPAWTSLSLLFWLSPAPAGAAVAVMLWALQLLYTQRFIYQSYLAIAVGNLPIVATMAVLLSLHPHWRGIEQALFCVCALWAVAFTLSGAVFIFRTQRALVRALADLAAEKARVEHNATHDALTGLANRGLFRRRLEDAVAARGIPQTAFHVFALDLDDFKAVNDTLGHATGDRLLTEVAARLQAVLPPAALLARLGGDEFAALLPGVGDADAAHTHARALIAAVGAPYLLDTRPVRIGVSVGMAQGADGDPETLLRGADLALYRAKSQGRNTACMFESAMQQQARARARLEADLRYGVQTCSFELHYQPQSVLDTGRLSGFEALVRWRHPERGLLPPADFFAALEELGLTMALCEWVLRQACRDASAWPGDIRVAVNISAAQFRSPDLPVLVTSALRGAGLTPGRLELEISEATLIQVGAEAPARLEALRAAGVRLAMDNFGAGASAIDQLRAFGFDRLKIDKRCVRDLATSPQAQNLLRAITGLGASLGAVTSAEGVETADQKARLAAERCVEGQGYLIGEPRPVAGLGEWLARGGATLAA